MYPYSLIHSIVSILHIKLVQNKYTWNRSIAKLPLHAHYMLNTGILDTLLLSMCGYLT